MTRPAPETITIVTTPEDHRIGNVRDMEFVETDQARIDGDTIRHLGQRIAFTLEDVQLAMHLLHEGVEMHPALALVHLDVGGATVIARVTHRSAAALELRPGLAVWAQIKAVALVG